MDRRFGAVEGRLAVREREMNEVRAELRMPRWGPRVILALNVGILLRLL